MQERDFIDGWLKELYYQAREASKQSLYNGTSDAIDKVIKAHNKINYYQHSIASSHQVVGKHLARWQKDLASVDSEVALYSGLGESGFSEYVSATFGERGTTTSSYIHDDKSVSYQESSSFHWNIPDGIEDFEALMPWAKNYYQEGIAALEAMMQQLEKSGVKS